MKLVTAGAIALAFLAAGCASVDLTPARGRVVAATEFVWKGETFKAGKTVKITARAGTFKPSDTTHTGEVDAGPGQTGILLGGMEHPSGLTQVALVRFVPQAWRDLASGAQVELGEFEATIHSEYLDVQK
jgi:hypothetical protein